MSKKKVFLLADSTTSLLNLYNHIKGKYLIKWIIYNQDVAEELKRNKISPKEIKFANAFGILNKKFKFLIIIKKILTLFHKNIFRKKLIQEITKIDEKFKPDLWLTDSGDILSEVNTQSPKCTFKHSITYKKHFLADNILKYDYIFLPGFYHYKRIKKYFKNCINKKKLIVTGSLKIVSYIKKRNLKFSEKNNLLKKNNLSKNRKNILFAPSYNAFGPNRFLPNFFGDQIKAIQEISDFVNFKLNCNFIIKLHHYHYKFLKNVEIKKIKNKKNNMLFESKNLYDIERSKNIIRLSDIIITDTSGVAGIGIFLGKKMIFLEPDTHLDSVFNWSDADIESNLRPGYVCKKHGDLFEALKKYSKSKDVFSKKRKKFVQRVFFKYNKNACFKISKSIKKIMRLQKSRVNTL